MDHLPTDAEMARFYAREAMVAQNITVRDLKAALRRVCDSLDTFIRESADPGAEALAALYEAQRLL